MDKEKKSNKNLVAQLRAIMKGKKKTKEERLASHKPSWMYKNE